MKQSEIFDAIREGNQSKFYKLLPSPDAPMPKNQFGYNLQTYSVLYRRAAMIAILAATGYSLNERDGCNRSPLSLSHPGMIPALIEQGAEVNHVLKSGDTTVLMETVEEGNLLSTMVLLRFGADPNAQDWEGRTALMRAIEGEELEIAQVLVTYPFTDLLIADNEGYTALTYAMYSPELLIIEAFVYALAYRTQKFWPVYWIGLNSG